MKKSSTAFGLALASFAAAAPAAAQTSWTGFHVGGRAGIADQAVNGFERIDFDTNLDGQFGDTVRTAAGADAFSPGFCGGAANGPTPAQGCREDREKGDFALMAGYDQQFGGLVFGIVGEVGRTSVRDSVAAFSTTPAFYTMTRRLGTNAAVRARLGATIGENSLAYATAGVATARVRRSFSTSNTVNMFPEQNDDDRATGIRYGGGLEHRFGNLSLGVLYLGTRYKDDDYRVRATGPAPATNPFIRTNPNGTDFRRTDENFTVHSLSLTLGYRL
jgi:outer membrane immunogenic protein